MLEYTEHGDKVFIISVITMISLMLLDLLLEDLVLLFPGALLSVLLSQVFAERVDLFLYNFF